MSEQAAAATAAQPAQSGAQGTLEQTQTQQAQQPSQPAQPKKWTSKVDGKEVTWDKEDDLVRDAGLGKAAFQRMREAADAQKGVKEFWETFQKDPMAALNHPNIKLTKEQKREIIEKYYQKEYLEADQLTPEQKRIRELEAEKAEWQAEKQREAETKKREADQKERAQWAEEYQKQIIAALKKGGIPNKPRSAARIAFHMAAAREAGYEAPLDSIVEQVRKDYHDEINDMCSDETPIEEVIKILPANLVKRLRKYDLDQYKARQAKIAQQPPGQPAEKPTKPKQQERLPYAEVLKRFG